MSDQGNHPAFPCEAQPDRDGVPPEHDYIQTGAYSGKFPGMSLRDYFAVHADQPGVSEIVTMAGGETADGFRVKFSADGAEHRFNDWWNDLPLADRLSLSARVRYAMADAMLEARKTGGAT